MRFHPIHSAGAALAAATLLSACGREVEAPTPAPIAATPVNAASAPAAQASTDAWLGKWVGVEGLALQVLPGTGPGLYHLQVTLMDGTNSYDGRADGSVIRFTRNGQPETLRAVSGDETGLKYLAGKSNCLMIKPAEGFCRE